MATHLHYQCQRCTTCCRWPGFVRLAEPEVPRIAAFLGLPEADFIQHHTRLTPQRTGLALLDKPNGECAYLEEGGCLLQEVKPKQCIGFPNDWNFPGWQETCKAIPMKLEIPDGDFGGYIFDCDGTLADTMPLHYEAWQLALAEHACEFPEALFYELGGVPTERIIEILNERHGHQLPVAETAQYKESLFFELLPKALPIEPVIEFVRQFYGQKPLAVASGGRRAIVVKTLTALGIVDQFDAIVGAEDYQNGKPAPDPFLEAARRIGVAPEKCLVFEDTQVGITAATAAGMKSVFVPSRRE